jgi:hypothetical protein
LEAAVALAIAYSREAHGDDMKSRLLEVTAVGRAAEMLWAASPRSPHWRDLDVDAFVSAIHAAGMDCLRDHFIGSLFGFTCFLAKYGLLSVDDALALRSRLDRYVPPLFLSLGYQPAVIPPALLPS